MKKLLLLAIVVLGISAVSFGQQSTDTEQATATAKIIVPIALQKNADLAFGNIIPGAEAGTVVLAASNARTGTNVTLGMSSSASAASFTVTGLANNTYSVTLPGDNAIELTSTANGAVAMKITTFTTFAVSGTMGVIEGGGTQVFKVGATLNVGANQAAGDYTGNFNVSVNYN